MHIYKAEDDMAFDVCPRCGCKDPSYFYKGSKGVYCRRCVGFGRQMMEEESTAVKLRVPGEQDGEYCLSFPLTPLQKEISRQLREQIHHTDVLLRCVCGAGKTEMVVETISDYLKAGKKVCFAIARRQVVLEVAERMQKYFHQTKVTAVCGGHTDVLDGGLIVCTTHQLYRYVGAFDLLVLDAYGIIGLNSKGSANKGFLKLSPILFSPQMRLMIDLRRKHAQNEDLSAKRSAACNSGSTVSDVVPSRLLQRQSAEHTPDVDLHRSTVRYSKDVSFACAA